VPVKLTEDQFADLVHQAIESLAPEFRRRLENLAVDIQPAPTAEQLARLKLRPGRSLLGLYQGVPLPDKSVLAGLDWPERITIFQHNVEAVCDDHRQVIARVRRTVLHEIGHHFGLDEDDLRELGYG